MVRYIAFYYDHTKEGVYKEFKLFFETNLDVTKNILIIGPHIKKNHMKIIRKSQSAHKILVIFEPIKNVPKYYKLLYNLIINCRGQTNNKNNFKLFGSVQHNLNSNLIHCKFPLYLFKAFNHNDSNQLLSTNNYVKSISQCSLQQKNFCCLINKWDPNGHRTKVHNLLCKLGKICCPSDLLNNCSNKELNLIGKNKYIKEYLFSICSENFDINTYPGYITEKLMDVCLGCAIPIYSGWFDEYDNKIFNKNRIIFYRSNEQASFDNMFKKIKELVEDQVKLLTFYKQPVFCETAFETIQQLKNDFIKNY